MVDDQDECEWINVSSSTGSPDTSQKKGGKMVLCVYVYVWPIILELLNLQLGPQMTIFGYI